VNFTVSSHCVTGVVRSKVGRGDEMLHAEAKRVTLRDVTRLPLYDICQYTASSLTRGKAVNRLDRSV
jgi:hypothetical protein